jgi:hypothetical protein
VLRLDRKGNWQYRKLLENTSLPLIPHKGVSTNSEFAQMQGAEVG